MNNNLTEHPMAETTVAAPAAAHADSFSSAAAGMSAAAEAPSAAPQHAPFDKAAAYTVNDFPSVPFDGPGFSTLPVEETPAGTQVNTHPADEAVPEPAEAAPAAEEAPAKPKKEKTGKGGGVVRWLLIATIALLVAIGGGYLGATLAVDTITDRVTAETEAQLDEFLADTDTSVLYRSVKTTTDPNAPAAVLDVTAVTELAADSVVEISTAVETSYGWFGYSIPYMSEGAGSGLILSENGYILTCHHVVDGATSIKITLRSGEEYEATYMGGDADLDIALLKVEAEGLSPVVLGDSNELTVGSPVVAIGNPLGQLGGTVTAGYISALEREVAVEDKTFTVLQTDAAINGGNSGGGLFNAKGELIGLVNAKASSVGVEGLGFAIPIDDIEQDIEDLINYGYVTSRVTLGVMLLNVFDDRTALTYQVEEMGVYIFSINENSNAELAGLQPFDRIISIDGEAIENGDRVVEIIGTKSVGDTIEMVIERNGEEMTFNVTLYAPIAGEGAEATPTAFYID